MPNYPREGEIPSFFVMKNLELKNCEHGKGVFLNEFIRAGDEILQFKGPLVNFKDLPIPYIAENDYYLQIGEDQFLGPSGELDDYVNHSCEPNSGIKFDIDGIKLVAIVPIKPGDQITFDYSTTMHNFDWTMNCACGSHECRQQVKNFVELSRMVQVRYIKLGIVPGYILNSLNRQSYSTFSNT